MALTECRRPTTAESAVPRAGSIAWRTLGLFANRKGHDGWLVRPTLRWEAGEGWFAYRKQRDNLYRGSYQLPLQRRCSVAGLRYDDRHVNCTAGNDQLAPTHFAYAIPVFGPSALPDGAVYASSAVKTPDRLLMHHSLSEAAMDTLDALHQHRLLTTSQLQEMILPGRTLRRTQQVLGELVSRQLVEWVAARGTWAGPAERVWFLSKRGGAVVDAAPNKAEPRLRLLTPEQAGGRLQPHTLAVNEIGLAFMRAARQRHDGFDVQSWRHEIAHDIKLGRRRRLVIADAVLKYWLSQNEHRTRLRCLFLELDRATLPVEDLLAKLGRYVDLRHCWRDYWQAGDWERARLPAWPSRYRDLPSLLVVLADSGRGNPEQRMRTVMGLCHRDGEITYDPAWFSFSLLEELVASGPFAPVFRRLEGKSLVNWLGQPPGVAGRAA